MQNNTENIYLIGMPSSGKSTLGRSLATHLGYEYVDMDDILVHQESRTIAQIFEENGEDYFRKIESDLLKTFTPNQKKMISTGGGVPCFFDNMDFIKKNGISIYLNVTPQSLFDRIINSTKNDRPLIDKSDHETLLKTLADKYKYRYQFYSQADIMISEDFTLKHILDKLKAKFL